MLGDLARSGFDVVDDHDEADAIVVNTCAFVEEAKAESLEVNFPCTRFPTSGLPYASVVCAAHVSTHIIT